MTYVCREVYGGRALRRVEHHTRHVSELREMLAQRRLAVMARRNVFAHDGYEVGGDVERGPPARSGGDSFRASVGI